MDWTNWLKQFGRYILVMIFQVLLFDQLQLGGLCHPYIYLLCLLMMPITLRPEVDMLIGAAAGLGMDVFCNSIGVHMAACILVMYLRRYILGILVNDRDRLNEQISWHAIGAKDFIEYVILLVVLHHLTIFAISAWSWSHTGWVLLQTLISSSITILVILAYNRLRYR